MDFNDQATLDKFYASMEFALPAYKHASFSYFAVKTNHGFILSQGRLHLQCVPNQSLLSHFQSENIRAGRYMLDQLSLTPRTFIEALLSGRIQTPDGEICFPPSQNSSHSLHFHPFSPDAVQSQQRQKQLFIRGERRPFSIDRMTLDWELKAAATPFENVDEICQEYHVGSVDGDAISVELAVYNVVAVSSESTINGTEARLVVLLAEGLIPDRVALGYRMFERGKVVKRTIVPGAAIQWSFNGIAQQGVIETEVPAGSVLQCYASYNGEAQQFYWVADPSTTQNPYRAAYQRFDEKLEALQDLMNKTTGKGHYQHEFETGIARLVWLLGFSVVHVGDKTKNSGTPDLIAVTPQGHFAVIECTTGHLKADNKLTLLVERVERVRQSLGNSGNHNLRVLGVIVTAKTRDEVKADLEQAQNLGIFVITRDSFKQLVERTLLFPDANKIYAEAENALRRTESPTGPSERGR